MISCTTYHFEDDGSIPNNPKLPLLVYQDALSSNQCEADAAKELLTSHHWTGAWVNGIYDYHHYHSTAHEVLAVIGGTAEVMMGGPEGVKFSLAGGDVLILPAGTGHCCLESSGNFRVVGAYPAGGQDYDLCTGKPEERPEVLANIRNVPLPAADPVTGTPQPLLDYWR